MNEIVEAFKLVLETKPLLIILSMFILGLFGMYNVELSVKCIGDFEPLV